MKAKVVVELHRVTSAFCIRHLLMNLEKSGLGSEGISQAIGHENLKNGKFQKLRTYVLIDFYQ